jgi:hypothetical protein
MSKVKCQTLFYLILFLILIIIGCDKKAPIPEEKFIKIYVDLLIVQDTTSMDSISVDSIKSIVFSKHNITPKTYDATINHYNSEPKKWEEFFDKAIVYAEKLKSEAEK